MLLAPALSSAEPTDPPWVLGDHRCSYTLISPRAALTTLHGAQVAMYPTDGPALSCTQQSTRMSFPGEVVLMPDLWRLPPAGLALVRFAEGAAFGGNGVHLPSYLEEARLLKDPKPGAPRTAGTRFFHWTKGGRRR